MFASLVLILRSSVPQRNASQIDGTSYLESIYGSSLGPEIWSDNLTGQTRWQVYSGNGTEALPLTFSNHTLNLTALFSGTSQPVAVSIVRRPINISLNSNPIAFATVNVSKQIHYGMRFSGIEPGNVPFQAWYETSPLQHRPGLGVNENLTASLVGDTFTANGQSLPQNSTITSIEFYLEATPGQMGRFPLILSRIAIVSTLQEPYADNAEYNGLIVHLSSAVQGANSRNESIFQAYVGYRIRGTPDLQYRLYFNHGLLTEAEGYVYHLKSVLDYEEAILLPQLVHDFPSVYSQSNWDYVSVSALQGNITYFKLDTLNLEYLSQTVTPSGYFDPASAQFLFAYYIIFLLVTPILIVILIGRAFRDEQNATNEETTGHS